MDDVISEAKSTGEYEGSVEDIRATSIELASQPEQITTDVSSGAPTKLAVFNVDRGCSIEKVCKTCQDMIPQKYICCSSGNDDDDKETMIEAHDNAVARSGFYRIKNPIIGRTLVLFATRRVQLSERDYSEDASNRLDFDPSGMMILTRPNTGTNPHTMATKDLLQKYRLVASIDDVTELLTAKKDSGDVGSHDVLSVMKECHSSFTGLWQDAYKATDTFEDGGPGLAPRYQKLGIGKNFQLWFPLAGAILLFPYNRCLYLLI